MSTMDGSNEQNTQFFTVCDIGDLVKENGRCTPIKNSLKLEAEREDNRSKQNDLKSKVKTNSKRPTRNCVVNESLTTMTSRVKNSQNRNNSNSQTIQDNVKRYVCKICKRSFTKITYFNVHKRMHRGEKPIKPSKCNVCNKKIVDSPRELNTNDSSTVNTDTINTENTESVNINSIDTDSNQLDQNRVLELLPPRLTERHFLERIPQTGKKMNPLRRCVVCLSKKVRKESSFQCKQCKVSVCVIPCFEMYHTLQDF